MLEIQKPPDWIETLLQDVGRTLQPFETAAALAFCILRMTERELGSVMSMLRPAIWSSTQQSTCRSIRKANQNTELIEKS